MALRREGIDATYPRGSEGGGIDLALNGGRSGR
jgi:hypothetical protein